MECLQKDLLWEKLGIERWNNLPQITDFYGSDYFHGLKWRIKIIIQTTQALKVKQNI